jgi:hypothetical protein
MDGTDQHQPDRTMRKALSLALMLVLFVPAFALLEALAASDNGERTPWLGTAAGAVVGLFFALVFAGALPRKWADALFGPSEEERP